MSSTIDIEAIAAILGGEDVLRAEVHDWGDLEQVVARGLPAESLRRTVRYTVGEGPGARALADRLVPPATRKRRAGAALTPEEGARVERLARVILERGDRPAAPRRRTPDCVGAQRGDLGSAPVRPGAGATARKATAREATAMMRSSPRGLR